MKLYEYQSKQLFADHGIPVPDGQVTDNAEEAGELVAELGGRGVVKAQVLMGGRGKAGGIRVVKSVDEARQAAAEILAMEIKELPVRRVLIERVADIGQEIYLAIANDRASGGPLLIGSMQGGVDIEEVAASAPEAIVREPIDPLLELRDFQARGLAAAMELPRDSWSQFTRIISGLYETYRAIDATLVEINPLVITGTGDLLALDGKINIDENALYRHPELVDLRDRDELTESERAAEDHGLSYVQLDGDIGCLVNGAGLAMASMDIIKLQGGEPANFLDIGGGAAADSVAAALEIILADPNVRSIMVNIFGGITRCDEVARGILLALEGIEAQVPMVVRLVGTNEEEGRRILADADMQTATSLVEAAQLAIEAARVGAVE